MSLCLLVDGLGVSSFLRNVAQQTWARPSAKVSHAWMVRDSQVMEDHPGFTIVDGNQLWIHQPLQRRPEFHAFSGHVLQELESDWSPPSDWASNETLILESITWQVLRRLRLLSTPEVLQADCDPLVLK
eukprot:symbB.v1.2.018307.t1/scaffold1451.1/size117964/3